MGTHDFASVIQLRAGNLTKEKIDVYDLTT